jgi:hypothetical protein
MGPFEFSIQTQNLILEGKLSAVGTRNEATCDSKMCTQKMFTTLFSQILIIISNILLA